MNESAKMYSQAKRNKEAYPPGTRIELIHMNDPFAPVPDGTRGTVQFVDDGGHLHMRWDNGRTLSIASDEDSFRTLTADEIAEEEIAKGHTVANLGDDCQIVIPDELVDCSRLGFFDELEEDCWSLVKAYCATLGIKMIPDEDGKPPISFDIAKGIQDKILGDLEEAGVQFNFDGQDETEDNTPQMTM